jgi:hypothetical protein
MSATVRFVVVLGHAWMVPTPKGNRQSGGRAETLRVSTPLEAVAEEAALGSRVRVVVIGDVAHVVVDVMLEREVLGDHHRELVVHVRELIGGRRHAVTAPHNHRDRADLTLRDPADVVLVEPLRDARRLAEIAVGVVYESVGHAWTIRHTPLPRPTPGRGDSDHPA